MALRDVVLRSEGDGFKRDLDEEGGCRRTVRPKKTPERRGKDDVLVMKALSKPVMTSSGGSSVSTPEQSESSRKP